MRRLWHGLVTFDQKLRWMILCVLPSGLIVLSAVLWCQSATYRATATALSTAASAAPGTVVAASRSKNRLWPVGYTFTDHLGRTHRSHQVDVPGTSWDKGQRVTVYFSPADPSRNAIARWSLEPAARSQRLVAIICLVVGVLMAGWQLVGAWRWLIRRQRAIPSV